MTTLSTSRRCRSVIAVITIMLLVSGLVPARTVQAAAQPSEVQPRPAGQVTSDALPTAQINGVALTQLIVGETVFVGGSFTSARPAGAAAGVGESQRSNILAYDLRTGALLPFAPVLNQQVKALAASPDGSRLYVGGQFTKVGAADRYRIAAFDVTSGQLVSSFVPQVDYTVSAMVATADTLFVGGAFSKSGTAARSRLAAFAAADGSVRSWTPTTNGTVHAMVGSPDGTKILAGGAFTVANGAPASGLVALDLRSGTTLPFASSATLRYGGGNSALLTLASDGTSVYGGGYTYGPGGNLEGLFKANWATGALEWVQDCHGDTYGVFANASGVYQVGHAHYCGNLGGWPQPSVWNYQYAMAFSPRAAGTLIHEPLGYANWSAHPAPALRPWWPTLSVGTFTGISQAAWTVTGNDRFIVLGGEFLTVNGQPQQGLVRFAVKGTTSGGVTAGTRGPDARGSSFVPALAQRGSGAVRVAFRANWDPDDTTLSYAVLRNGTAAPVWTTSAASSWFNRPSLGFTDSGLTPGATVTYRVRATDPDGNSVTGQPVSVTVPETAGAQQSPYGALLIAQGAGLYWPLDDRDGVAVVDGASVNDGSSGTSVTRAQPGLFPGTAAMSFRGMVGGTVSTIGSEMARNAFTVSVWFRTSTVRGGRILGFSDLPTGASGHADRSLHLDNTGRLVFGVFGVAGRGATVAASLSSARSLNDGRWHHAAASLGPDGMALYVDGVSVGARADVTAAEQYIGHWRVGGDTVTGLPFQPTSRYLDGTIDEVAVFPSVLSAAQVNAQFTLARAAAGPG